MPLNPSDYSVLFAISAVLLLAALILLAICNAKRKKLAGTAFSDQLTGGLSERAFLWRSATTLKGRAAAFGMAVYCSHGMERTHIDGLKATCDLLLAYLMEC